MRIIEVRTVLGTKAKQHFSTTAVRSYSFRAVTTKSGMHVVKEASIQNERYPPTRVDTGVHGQLNGGASKLTSSLHVSGMLEEIFVS
jgi:hypothetical protein